MHLGLGHLGLGPGERRLQWGAVGWRAVGCGLQHSGHEPLWAAPLPPPRIPRMRGAQTGRLRRHPARREGADRRRARAADATPPRRHEQMSLQRHEQMIKRHSVATSNHALPQRDTHTNGTGAKGQGGYGSEGEGRGRRARPAAAAAAADDCGGRAAGGALPMPTRTLGESSRSPKVSTAPSPNCAQAAGGGRGLPRVTGCGRTDGPAAGCGRTGSAPIQGGPGGNGLSARAALGGPPVADAKPGCLG